MPNGNAFDFLPRPNRGLKPRTRGLTVALDRAKSLVDVQSSIDVNGDILDHIKISDHPGIMWRYPAEFLKKKNQIYAKAGIHTLPGGIPFEIAVIHDKVPQFMKRVAELGFTGVEVADDSIDLRAADRAAAIECGRAAGLEVFTEIGKKLPEKLLDASEAIEMAQRDLDAGAFMVVIEKSEIVLAIRNKSDVIHRLMEGVGEDKLVLEHGPGSDQWDVAKWIISEFGPDANLENVLAEDAYTLEAMRYGLHRSIDYTYFHPYRGKALPAISS